MLNFELKLFGIHIIVDILFPKMPKKVKNSSKKDEKDGNADKGNETPKYEDNPLDYLYDESKISQIAEQFKSELKEGQIYDIPYFSDVPPNYNIQTDVEIITDDFEKEVEDMIEGRR